MVDGLLGKMLSRLGSKSVLLFLIIVMRKSKLNLPTMDHSFSLSLFSFFFFVCFFCYCLETVYLLKSGDPGIQESSLEKHIS